MNRAERIEALNRRRDNASANRDLAEALSADDQLEDLGQPADNRITSWTCQSWFDHAHHPLTGQRITIEEFHQQPASSGAPAARGSHTDPRVVGGRYRSAYWGIEYTVNAITFGRNGCLESITVTDKDGTRTHGTAWDRRDERSQP